MGLKRFTRISEWDVKIGQGIFGMLNMSFLGEFCERVNPSLSDVMIRLQSHKFLWVTNPCESLELHVVWNGRVVFFGAFVEQLFISNYQKVYDRKKAIGYSQKRSHSDVSLQPKCRDTGLTGIEGSNYTLSDSIKSLNFQIDDTFSWKPEFKKSVS
jgi:hypothetical protein